MPVVYAASDLHGHLPAVPSDAELLLLAGDICPDFRPYGKHQHWGFGIDTSGLQQLRWLDTDFREWLEGHGMPVIATWGNHDYVGEKPLWPPDKPLHNLFMLRDHEATILGVRVWGTPWVPKLQRWAFYANERALNLRADLIPDGLDILMTHGPPLHAGDFVPFRPKYAAKYNVGPEGDHAGDPTISRRLAELVKPPQFTICGHIHEARGWHEWEGHEVINVAAVNEMYDLHENPWTKVPLAK